MFIQFLILSAAGFLVFLLFSIAKFNKSTKTVKFSETLYLYFIGDYRVLPVVATFIILCVLSYLLTIPGKEWFVQWFTGGQVPSDTPFGILITAFLLGFCGLGIGNMLYGLVQKSPMQYNVADEKTDGQ